MVALEVWNLPKNHGFSRRSCFFEAESAASTTATEEGPSAGHLDMKAKSFHNALQRHV